eukprot:CAMPEP_0196781570 /NCGR_PEP_ID=MMETSP1104-20130614/9829_1 /TAXON_ID=33652 /ORGANISM="Cafeteria sp., Strain Caron Lab Isolate" /LENGTH=442 /DNA_ID=CAMNT_0042151803 /DNA_START=6 /DNA_END=1334 /DNA_ORIENTATION=+
MSTASFAIHPGIEAVRSEIIETRRYLHAHPELSFEEFETAKLVARKLREWGIEVEEGVGRTGVVGTLCGASERPCIAFRADMDALPIQETTGLEFASTVPGKMHACGHDGHVAELLGVAKALAARREELKGSVKFLFQPAEEGKGGARVMVADGCLEGVDLVYGIHLWTYDEVGVVGLHPGPVMAASDRFEIVVRGAGGHGAAPQGTVDAIVAAAQIVQSLQSVVSRNVDPLKNAVLTVGQINGGYNYNIICDEVRLVGTVRTFDRDIQELVVKRMHEVTHHTAAAHGATATLEYYFGYPPTVNTSDACLGHVRRAALRVVPEALVRSPFLSMGAEDFSYFLHERPGCFFFVGASPAGPGEEPVPHHKSNFTIHEEALMVAASVFVGIVEDLLVKADDAAAAVAEAVGEWVKPPPPPKHGLAEHVTCACDSGMHETLKRSVE